MPFLSTLSLRRATAAEHRLLALNSISIHALLAESDYIRSNVPNFSSISIHALLAESDGAATLAKYQYLHFYPRSPCGERPTAPAAAPTPAYFYPRSPCGERPERPVESRSNILISIHALLAESDLSISKTVRRIWHFYPRSPCGERPGFHIFRWSKGIISIHALLAESDIPPRRSASCNYHFYPRSPCGERRGQGANSQPERQISIHALLAESDVTSSTVIVILRISIHALLAESDSKSAQNSGALLRIWNKFYGDCIFMLTGKAVFYPFCPCFFHIFWCEGTENFMIAFPSH